MKGIAAFMVLSLLSRSHVTRDDRQYDHPRPDVRHTEHHTAVTSRYTYPSQDRIWKPTQ